MSFLSDATRLQGIVEDRARAVVRSQQMRYEWRSVVEVLGPKVEGRGGTATVVDGAGAASYGVRWFERRPLAGDLVLVEIPPPGGTRRIVAIDREITDTPVSLPVYTAESFGAKGDGTTDDTSALNEAFAYIGALGGGILLGVSGGVHVVNSGLVLNVSLVRFDLNGGSLLRTGTSTDPVLFIKTDDGALTKINRSGISNGTIDGGSVAQGVHVTSANYLRIEMLTIQNCTTQIYMDCWDTRPALSDARDNQHCILRDLRLIATGSQNGLKITGNSDAAIAAGNGANTSLNRFDNIWVTVADGDGFYLGNADGNVFSHLRVNRTGTGRGLVLAAHSATGGHARDNLFYAIEMTAAGTWALSDVEPSANNIIFGNNRGNGGSSPNIAGAATLWYFNNDGTGNIGGGGGGPPSGAAGGDLGGTYPNPSVVQAGGQFSLAGSGNNITTTGTITDQTITNARLRWNGASAATLAGVAGGVAGRVVIVSNVTAAQVLTLAHESGSEATTGNRLSCPGNVDLLLNPNEVVWLFYETTSNRWRVMFRRITVGEVDSLFDATVPTTSALADAAATGSSTTAAHRDHRHGRESFGSTSAAIGTSAGGSATTPSHSDHVHATGAGTPAAVSTANAIGTGPAAAMTDHVHAHETAHIAHDTIWDTAGDLVQGTGSDTAAKLAITVPAANILNVVGVVNGETSWSVKSVHDGTAAAAIGTAAAGTALTSAHRDHVHPTGAGTPSTQAFGDAAATGTGPAGAMTDHKHAMPAAPTAASVGASANPHGAADHTDITRTVWLDAASAKLDSGTAATLGTAPNSTPVIAFADAATQGCFWDVSLPADWGSGTLIFRPMWAPGATDATPHTARFSLDVKSMAAGDDVTAAGTTVAQTGASAARTANLLVSDNTIDSTVTPSSSANVVRVNIRRVGADAADTYVGVVNLLGLRLSYTANQ